MGDLNRNTLNSVGNNRSSQGPAERDAGASGPTGGLATNGGAPDGGATSGASTIGGTTGGGARGPASGRFNHMGQGTWRRQVSPNTATTTTTTTTTTTGTSSFSPASPASALGRASVQGGGSGSSRDAGAVGRFLEAFPTMQALLRAYPELDGLNPFELEADAFEEALVGRLGEKQYEAIRPQFPPETFRAGLRELRTREFRDEAGLAPMASGCDEPKEERRAEARSGLPWRAPESGSRLEVRGSPTFFARVSATHRDHGAREAAGQESPLRFPQASGAPASGGPGSRLRELLPCLSDLALDLSAVDGMDPFACEDDAAFDADLCKRLGAKAHAELTGRAGAHWIRRGLACIALTGPGSEGAAVSAPAAAYVRQAFPELSRIGSLTDEEASALLHRLEGQFGPSWFRVLGRMDMPANCRRALDRLCVLSALAKYPSLPVLQAKTEKLGDMGYNLLIQQMHLDPASFARMIATNFGQERYQWLIREFGTLTALRTTLHRLRERELAKGRGTLTVALPRALMMHEIGARPRSRQGDPVRLMALAGDRDLVRLAMYLNYDIEKLGSFESVLENKLERVRENFPLFMYVSFFLSLNKNKGISGVKTFSKLDMKDRIPNERSRITNSDEFPKFAFYSELLKILISNKMMEMLVNKKYDIYNILQSNVGNLRRFYNYTYLMVVHHMTNWVMYSYLRDISASHTFGDDDYLKAMVPSLLAIYEGGFSKGVMAFVSGARAIWPKLPRPVGPDYKATDQVRAARAFAERTKLQFLSRHEAYREAFSVETGWYGDEAERKAFGLWVYTLAYYRRMDSDEITMSEIHDEIMNFVVI